MGVAKCVVPENIRTPPEGTFALDPPIPLEFPFLEVLVIPSPHGISVNFKLVGYPLERIFVSKMLLHYIIMRKIIFLR